MASLKHWISSARLRTLPLALSSILCGSAIALKEGSFSNSIFGLTILTTILLQVLSNFANDYGDAVNGADHKERKGPDRMVSAGLISKEAMKKSLYVFASLSFVSGITLLLISFSSEYLLYLGIMLLLGLFAIWAAIKYTAGDNPYGYAGLGDVFVLIFFGWVGVIGSSFLQTKTLDPFNILPATAIGLLAMGVLNVNNMRDINSDEIAGKKSIPVRVGMHAAKIYHTLLLVISMILLIVWSSSNGFEIMDNLYLLIYPILIMHLVIVWKNTIPEKLDPQLKIVALSSFLISLSIFLSQYL